MSQRSRGSEDGPSAPVVVVGAGISGLATALHLTHAGVAVQVLEASSRVGGALRTQTDGGWLFELGPNTVLEKEPVSELLSLSGLEGERLPAASAGRRRYLWLDGRLQVLPRGPLSFLTSRLFPLRAKLSLLREPWVKKAPVSVEESIAQFVRRRLGRDWLERAVGPFVSGVYAGDPERLSVRWAVPRLHALEREHGSLIRGALAKRKGPAPGGAMVGFREGFEGLARQLAERLGDVRPGVEVQEVVPEGGRLRVVWDTGSLTASQVVLAVPADAAASLLAGATAGRSQALAEIPYAPVVVASLGLRRLDVAHPLDGFGFLVPRNEGLRILGCLFPSIMFPGRAPEGHVALTAFLGGRTDPQIVSAPDEEILQVVLGDLGTALGLRGDPVTHRTTRWPLAIPQYELGHGRFVTLAQKLEEELPGLHLAGSYLGGVSVADCCATGAAVARRIVERRREPPST
jgi:protoporphyrinogen/coproporphyrinogen III oxidase